MFPSFRNLKSFHSFMKINFDGAVNSSKNYESIAATVHDLFSIPFDMDVQKFPRILDPLVLENCYISIKGSRYSILCSLFIINFSQSCRQHIS